MCVRQKSKGFQITPSGRYLSRRSAEIVKMINDAEAEIESRMGELVGPVALGCYVGLAANILPPVLEQFERDHPGVEISLGLADHSTLLPRVSQGRLDFVIGYDQDIPFSYKREKSMTPKSS